MHEILVTTDSADARVPRWRQIAQALADRIAAGHYAHGKLPSEHALAAEFEVNRHTVRQALGSLKERGLLDTRQGRGSAVRAGVFEYALGKRTRFSQNLARQQSSGRLEVLDVCVEPAAAAVARALGVRTRHRVERVETVGYAGDVPISNSTHWFSARRFAGIGDAIARTHSITQAFKQMGVDDYVRATTRITAELPSVHQADVLQLGTRQPILLLESHNHELNGGVVQYSVTAFAADRVQLVIDHGLLE